MGLFNKLLCFFYGHKYSNVHTNKNYSKETQRTVEKIKDECKICNSIKITTNVTFREDTITKVNYFNKSKIGSDNE